jgi:hypothetical protein
MSDDKDKPPMGTAEAGMVAIGRAAAQQPTDEEVQAGILRSMGEVVASPYNPQALRAPDKVRVANAPVVEADDAPKPGSGWVDPKPLPVFSAKGSREEALIDNLVRAYVGGPNEKKE